MQGDLELLLQLQDLLGAWSGEPDRTSTAVEALLRRCSERSDGRIYGPNLLASPWLFAEVLGHGAWLWDFDDARRLIVSTAT